jgi:hypothetical protein
VKTHRGRFLAKQALEELERAPMRSLHMNPVAYEILADEGHVETYRTDVGAVWVRISDAGRAALEATRIKINT